MFSSEGVVSVPCIHYVTPRIAEKFAYPSKSVGHLSLPATVLNDNNDIYMDNYEPPTKDDFHCRIRRVKKSKSKTVVFFHNPVLPLLACLCLNFEVNINFSPTKIYIAMYF